MRAMQEKIITELGTRPSIIAEEEFQQRSEFLASRINDARARGFVLGISGGQDSLLAALIAMRACAIAKANGKTAEFHAVLLPYNRQADRDDALAALEVIQPHHTHDINIGPSTDSFSNSFNDATLDELTDFNKGNVKARMRMIAQYALTGQYGLLVIGADHAAEAITGFYTKFGDGGADVLPLAGLNKRQGRQMLVHLGAPALFTEKQPTADLLDNAPLQTDETELGVSYETIDDYLEGKAIDDSQAEMLELRFTKTAHKRQMPFSYADFEE